MIIAYLYVGGLLLIAEGGDWVVSTPNHKFLTAIALVGYSG